MTAHGTDRPWQDVPIAVSIPALAAALLVAPAVGGLVTGPRAIAAAIVLALLADAWGRALRPWLGVPSTAPQWLAGVVVGYAAASMVHLGATVALDVDVWIALVVDVLIAAAATRTARRRRTPAAPAADAVAWNWQVAALLACALLAALWARETILAVPTAVTGGVFPAWQDYFLHGAEVSYLRDYPAYAGRSQYLTAIPQPLYHRGSFALSAVFSALAEAPSLATATAFWLPTGLFLAMGATFAFGAALGGPLAGVGALAAVFLVPDASSYGAENHFLSFHWLMQMASGSGYGIAVALTGTLGLVTAPPEGRTRAILTAVVLFAATAVFRVHIALLATAMLGWFVLGAWRPAVTGTGLLASLAVAASAGLVLRLMESISLAPHFFTGQSHPVLFFHSVLTQANDLPSFYRQWREVHSDAVNVIVGFSAMLWAGLGVSLFALPIVAATGVVRRMGPGAVLTAVALLLGSLTVIVVVPTPAHGDITDFGHRPFVLVYLVVAALAGAGAARLVAEGSVRATGRLAPAAFAMGLLAAAGLVTPWREGARIQQRWVPQYATLPVAPELFRAGAYVKSHGVPGEQIVAAGEDHYAMLVALTERRAYLSRTDLFKGLGGENAAAVEARVRAHSSLGPAPTLEQLRAFGKSEGVAWYIADTPASLQWPDATAEACAYCGDVVRVYDLR